MTTKHANEFTITCAEIAGITYRTNSAYVSAGQPFDVPPKIESEGSGKWKITFESGRHKTSAVAESFIACAGGSKQVMITASGGDKTPDELNFYFGLNLSIRSSTQGPLDDLLIYLGQGSNALHNNWWLGSLYLINPNGKAALVGTKSGKIAWRGLIEMANAALSISPKD